MIFFETTGKPYKEVYDELFMEIKKFAANKRSKAAKEQHEAETFLVFRRAMEHPRSYHKFLIESVGMIWCPKMLVGQGCKVHLIGNELPSGKLIERVPKYLTAVIDGVINDVFDNDQAFGLHLEIAEELNIKTFFTRPYTSQDKGSIENRNGVIRRFYPKKTDFTEVIDSDVRNVEKMINKRSVRKLVTKHLMRYIY